MSVRLVFQDRDHNPLTEEGIALEWLSPPPKIGEICTFPDGQRVKVLSREFHYLLAAGPATTLEIIFECEQIG